MARRCSGIGLAALTLTAFSACSEDGREDASPAGSTSSSEASASSASESAAETRTPRKSRSQRSQPTTPPKVTRCADVRLPEEGIGEADFNLDKTRGFLDINFSDTRGGRYRNISYTVRYRSDPTCATVPSMAELIDRVAADAS
jgi:hypothetical protein